MGQTHIIFHPTPNPQLHSVYRQCSLHAGRQPPLAWSLACKTVAASPWSGTAQPQGRTTTPSISMHPHLSLTTQQMRMPALMMSLPCWKVCGHRSSSSTGLQAEWLYVPAWALGLWMCLCQQQQAAACLSCVMHIHSTTQHSKSRSCSLALLLHQPCTTSISLFLGHSAELGIDIPSILSKTKAILLHQMKSNTLDELDFGGALIFLLALGCLHLMVSVCVHSSSSSCSTAGGGFEVPTAVACRCWCRGHCCGWLQRQQGTAASCQQLLLSLQQLQQRLLCPA